VDIRNLKAYADGHPEQVVGETYDDRDAQSVRRQFSKLGGYKVMTTKAEEPGMRRVLIQKTKEK